MPWIVMQQQALHHSRKSDKAECTKPTIFVRSNIKGAATPRAWTSDVLFVFP